jgi:hypothetical protein
MRQFIVITFLTISINATAQIYECTDSNGNKEFAQVCPPDTVQQVQKGGSAAATSSDNASGNASASKSLPEQQAEFRKRMMDKKAAQDKADKDAAKAKEDESNCNDARSNLKALQEGIRIFQIDPNTGERSYMPDSDRPAALAKAQQRVDSVCKTN